MFDTPGNILLFTVTLIFIIGIVIVDYLNRKKVNKKVLFGLSILFSSIPLNLISQFLYYKIYFSKFDSLRIAFNGSYNNQLSFTDYLPTIFQDYFSLTYFSFINTDFNPRWIFVIVNLILIIGFLYYAPRTVNIKKTLMRVNTKNIMNFLKYLLFVIPLKPLITFIAYPVPKYIITGRLKRPTLGERRESLDDSKFEPFGYHIDNIFEYEVITFLYALIPILILYLFIEGKNFTSNSRVNNLKKLFNQGIITQEEFDKKLQEIKEEELKKV